MSDSHSDALVFFGATGDLAYKKIFPALQAMLQRGRLDALPGSAQPRSCTLELIFYQPAWFGCNKPPSLWT